MGNESAIVFSGIAPHPPIMVPEVGREAIAEVRGSIEAMAELTKRIIASGAETVVLISPHAPLNPYAFVAYQGPRLYGDFAYFSAPAISVEAALDDELLEAIGKAASAQEYEVANLKGYDLDHGTAVPLYFLRRNGWNGRVVALGYSFLSNDDHLRFGACIGQASDKVGRPVALVASGDLSHRLKPEAPGGYNPTAYIFDEVVVDALRCNAPERIVNVDQELRRLAGECGYRSMLVAFGATRELPPACAVLNYEAPFGVGYLVAQLTNKKADEDFTQPQERSRTVTDEESSPAGAELPALVRKTIETYVLTGAQIKPPLHTSALLAARAACFVTIRSFAGELRGCIGTIEPVQETLAEELIANAINSAARDPRFPPVSANELTNLCYSVDVLSTPEPSCFDELDPVVYGVIVEDETGSHRGLLLPDIEGVDTITKQVEIATRKAGIPPGIPLKFSRFRVERFREADFAKD
jgi:AmmeMemoRadiSam system protein A/AmmeMemoRadiSam system protein B